MHTGRVEFVKLDSAPRSQSFDLWILLVMTFLVLFSSRLFDILTGRSARADCPGLCLLLLFSLEITLFRTGPIESIRFLVLMTYICVKTFRFGE